MSKKAILRGTVRGLTGLIITVIAALCVVMLMTHNPDSLIPVSDKSAPAVKISTKGSAQRSLGCMGGFAALGFDTGHSEQAIPIGTSKVINFGGTVKRLESVLGGQDAKPNAIEAKDNVAGVAIQGVNTPDLQGAAMVSCAEPLTDQWIVGGDTKLGSAGALTIVNPGQRPASVEIRAYSENGIVNADKPAGVMVPAGNSRTVSLNGLIPAANAVAVHINSLSTPVYATLSTSKTSAIHPNGVDVQGAQTTAAQELTIIGMRGQVDEAEHIDPSDPVNQVSLFVPGTKSGTVHLLAIMPDGSQKEILTTSVQNGKVVRIPLPEWPKDATVLRVTSDVPIYGSGYSRRMIGGKADYAWLPASQTISAGSTPAVIVEGGLLQVFNPVNTKAKIVIKDANSPDKRQEISLAAGAYKEIQGLAQLVTIEADQPVQASVQMVKDAQIASYQIMPILPRDTEMLVFPK